MRTNSGIPEGVGSAGLTVHRDTRTGITYKARFAHPDARSTRH
jgi:hypothetical protein